MAEQFARITAEEIIREYHLGFLTATGVVRYYIKCSQAYNWRREYCPKELYEMLGISKSAFYKAIASLKTLGYIDFDVQGKVGITNTEPGDGILSKNAPSTNEETVHKKGRASTEKNERPQKRTAIPNYGQPSTAMDEESSKALPEAKPSGSPDLIQINQIKSSSINQEESQNANPDDDDDDLIFSSQEKEQPKEKPIIGDRHKRMVKALKATLMECSSDPKEWDGFFDWCEAELWPSFNEPVSNKIGWLKSIEPDSGLTRLEFNWDNYLCDQSNKNAPASSEIDLLWERARKLAKGSNDRSATSDFINKMKEPRFYQAVWKIGIYKLSELKGRDLIEAKQLFTETYENWVEPKQEEGPAMSPEAFEAWKQKMDERFKKDI